MSESPSPCAELAGPWYRIVTVPAPTRASSAEGDFVSILPAVLTAAQRRKPFVIGWLSRGAGAPLQLIGNAGPLPAAATSPATSAATSAAGHAGRVPAGPLSPGDIPGVDRGAMIAAASGHAPGPGTAADSVDLLFPNGARGVPAGDGWLADAQRLVWTVCPGRQAPPLLNEERQDSPQPSLFESTLVTLMDRPFGWLIVAEPTDSLDAEAADLRTQLTALRRFDEERAKLDVERAERRVAELDAFREGGLWHVRVLVGAATPAELERVAPVLVGSVDLSRHPYRLRSGSGHEARHGKHADAAPGDAAGVYRQGPPPPTADYPQAQDLGTHRIGAYGLADALAARAHDHADQAQVPFAATAGVIAALAGLPRREVPGLRVLDTGYFDLTSETDNRDGRPGASTEMIEFGTILDAADRPVGALRVPLATLNRHVFVAGATGAGKSQTVRHLLERLTEAGLPWLAIEPAKSEYAAMAGRVEGISQVTVINPSDPHAIPLSVNPLAPEPGYPVQAHIDMVRALFQAAFDSEEPFPQIMSQALQRVYEANGWDMVTGSGVPGAIAPPAVPTLEQLQRTALEVIEDVGYGPELQADVRGFVDVRLRSLRIGSAGRFFQGGHPADIGELLCRNVVLAIEDVANDEDKAFLMGTLIIRIVEHLRLRARRAAGDGLRHVIVIEEAHRLLRNRGQHRASSHAVELFAGMLAEIRAYGEGVVVAEQIPTKLVPDVVKNTALKVVHRLPAHDDRQLVGAAMNLDDEQSRQVVSLRPGIAAVFADGMDRPLRVRVPLGEQRERVLDSPDPPICDRRSAACGWECRQGRACTLYKLREAELMAASAQDVWLRIWVETLVLAFLTGRELPAVPEPARRRWAGLESDNRLRECMAATVIDRTVGARSTALRDSYDPERLTRSVADTALRILAGEAGLVGTRPGPSWVIPQLRWLHEADRALAAESYEQAPVLTYDLLGVADGPGVTAAQRIGDLERHPLSVELGPNRARAWTALVGNDEHASFFGDLAIALIGIHSDAMARVAAEIMRTGWLLDVLSWPQRFMPDAADGDDVPPAAVRQPPPPEPRVKEGLLGARPPGSRGRRKRR